MAVVRSPDKLVKLFAPKEYWQLTPSGKADICNGCGSSLATFDFIPDRIWGLVITEVCNIHDLMYLLGTTEEDKIEADLVMLINLIILINDYGGFLEILRYSRAMKCYQGVHFKGAASFWMGKERHH